MLPLVKLTMLSRFWLIVLRAYLVAASRLVNMSGSLLASGPSCPCRPVRFVPAAVDLKFIAPGPLARARGVIARLTNSMITRWFEW